jgi:GNAT superfamily N-acetyltransferase
MLARAFDDDPVSTFLMPSPRRRPPGLRTFFRVQMVTDFLPFGGVFTTEDLAGAALWAPPGKPMPDKLRELWAVLPVVPYVAGRNFSRSLRFLAQIEAIHPKEPHWYLAILGTDPSRQGQGVGSALLQPVLDRCDADGTRAYLESSKERNIPFYRRHGFEVTGEVKLAGGPPVWTMWRDPRPAGG